MRITRVGRQRDTLRDWKTIKRGTLERELVDAVHAYWKLQSGEALLEAITLLHLPEIHESDPDSRLRLPIAIEIGGWAYPSQRRLLSKTELKKANRDVVGRVGTHRKRADVGNALGRRFKRSGFRVEAYFTDVPWRFLDVPTSGPAVVRASTPDARKFLTEYLGVDPEDVEGFSGITIDRIKMYDMSVTDPLGRLAMLAPEELTVAINASGRTELARALSERFRGIPSLSEWCDRWSFIAGTDDFAHEARRALHIRGPQATADWNEPARPYLAFPELEPQAGRLVRAVAGRAPVLNYPAEILPVDDCWIQNGGTAYTDRDLYVLDRMADPRHERGDEVYIDVYGAASRGDTALLLEHPDSGRRYEEAIFIGGRHDFNWYHWIIEYLPRLLDADGTIDEHVPVLVSDQVPGNGVAALRRLTSREVMTLPRHGRVKVGRLHLSAPAMGVPDNYLARWQRILHADVDCLQRFRNAVRDSVPAASGTPEKVFLKRNSKHRSLENQDELQALAESMGFVPVALEKLDFPQQVQLFRSARQVVGCSGAAMANYLFSGPDTSVIDLVSRHNIDSPLPALVCALSGAQFAYLYGDPEHSLASCRSLHQARHSSFTVREADLARALAQ